MGNAADLKVSIQGGKLATRVTNRTGHKLPPGGFMRLRMFPK